MGDSSLPIPRALLGEAFTSCLHYKLMRDLRDKPKGGLTVNEQLQNWTETDTERSKPKGGGVYAPYAPLAAPLLYYTSQGSLKHEL